MQQNHTPVKSSDTGRVQNGDDKGKGICLCLYYTRTICLI
jgi:hypothetical protein